MEPQHAFMAVYAQKMLNVDVFEPGFQDRSRRLIAQLVEPVLMGGQKLDQINRFPGLVLRAAKFLVSVDQNPSKLPFVDPGPADLLIARGLVPAGQVVDAQPAE